MAKQKRLARPRAKMTDHEVKLVAELFEQYGPRGVAARFERQAKQKARAS